MHIEAECVHSKDVASGNQELESECETSRRCAVSKQVDVNKKKSRRKWGSATQLERSASGGSADSGF